MYSFLSCFVFLKHIKQTWISVVKEKYFQACCIFHHNKLHNFCILKFFEDQKRNLIFCLLFQRILLPNSHIRIKLKNVLIEWHRILWAMLEPLPIFTDFFTLFPITYLEMWGKLFFYDYYHWNFKSSIYSQWGLYP